jgi:hypothetical protein
MVDTPDGTTWTGRGTFLAAQGGSWGEPYVAYIGSKRYLMADLASPINGNRMVVLFTSANQDTSWVQEQCVLKQNSIAWESVQVFDSGLIYTNIGDGNGTQLWLLYAGSDNSSTGDATNSSIGLALVQPPPNPVASGGGGWLLA